MLHSFLHSPLAMVLAGLIVSAIVFLIYGGYQGTKVAGSLTHGRYHEIQGKPEDEPKKEDGQ